MFGSTNTKLWNGGTQYGYIMAEYPEGSQCQITRELDDTVLKARGNGSNWAFALPEVIGLKVPKEYQEVEYLQSSGTQYIDCGYIPIDTERYIIDGMFFANSSMNGTYGGQGWSFCYSDGTYQARTVGIRYDKSGADFYRHIFDWSKSNFTVDGISYTSATSAGFVIGNYNLWLFGPGPGYGGNKLNGRIYDAKTYIGDNLIHHYIPCYRKSDSVAGMYDAVTNTFFTNAGTGTFVIGPVTGGDKWTAYCTDGEAEGEKKVNILYNGDIQSIELDYRVPAEYQAVQYLERPINQLVRYDTGITPISTDFIAIRFEVLQKTSTPALCGAYSSSSSRWYMVYSEGGTYTAYSGSMTVSRTYSLNTIYEAQFVNGNTFRWSADGGETFIDQAVSDMGGAPYSFALFTMKNGSSSYLSDVYAHSVRIYSATVQDAEFIPCYRKSDSVPGFWNRRDKVFLENLGDGTIIAGPNV